MYKQVLTHCLLLFATSAGDLIDSVKLWNYYRKTICLFHVKHNVLTRLSKNRYCSLVISREVFFVSEGHRKPKTYRANLCD